MTMSFISTNGGGQWIFRRAVQLFGIQSAGRGSLLSVQKYDMPGTSLESVIAIAEIAPNVLIGRHNHPGPESGCLLEGELVLMIDDRPPKPLKPGDSYQIPSEAIHDAKSGAGGAKILPV